MTSAVLHDLVAALCAAAALLLVASGAAKVARPQATTATVDSLVGRLLPRPRRRPLLRVAARLVGVGEVAVGVVVLAVGGRPAAVLLAAAYLVFAAVAARLATAADPVSCGCFGRSDAPVGVPHVVLDLAAAAVAIAAIGAGLPAGGGLFDDGAAVAVGGPLLVALVTWSAYLAITALPALSSARRLVEAP
ncbi:hypothetical protein SAMN05443575_1585 [Jatrophihabitans endophyticus]|uniref:Methylamine utilisation protein MauE domain-containing protein n=1 Tax=Jatrophihabitans endophyticus TaxID=1206085 RepID=A0A1M5HP34_9ACTN|nr:MauE/DoxX family redox-associated membrane protein [Jatrophihabitans endophyticus]SHG17658.1 hypothetical protein SAMN05443575_1585 [Jatrophihabitans endophyticus]